MSTAMIPTTTVAPIVQTEQDIAESQIAAAWDSYQAVEKHGIEFGRVLYGWQQKFSAQGSRTGGGLRPTLDKVGIPHSTAYYWITRFKESQGLVSRPKSDSPNQPQPKPEKVQPEEIARALQDDCRKAGLPVDVKPSREMGKFNITYHNVSENEIRQAIDSFKAGNGSIA